MEECLSVGNQPWVKNASVLLICIANKNFQRNGELNRHYMHDTGMANANLLTQATAMGIYCHILGGYDHVKTDQVFSISPNEEVVCFIALGYLGNGEQLEEPYKTREITPRSRKPIKEVARQF
jgi:nitroreductase